MVCSTELSWGMKLLTASCLTIMMGNLSLKKDDSKFCQPCSASICKLCKSISTVGKCFQSIGSPSSIWKCHVLECVLEYQFSI